MPWLGDVLNLDSGGYDADRDDLEAAAGAGAQFIGAPMTTSYMPIEGGATDANGGAWWQKPLTYAFGRWIDSEFPAPFAAGGGIPSNQIGVAANGALFYRGLPGAGAVAQANPYVMIGVLALLGLGAAIAFKK